MLRFRLPSIGLLLTVIFLAHDALMGGGAHSATGAHGHAAVPSRMEHDGTVADAVHLGSSDRVAGCSTVRFMAPVRTGTNGDGHAAPAKEPLLTLAASNAPSSLPAVGDHGGPPGVQRAYLQIWRI